MGWCIFLLSGVMLGETAGLLQCSSLLLLVEIKREKKELQVNVLHTTESA